MYRFTENIIHVAVKDTNIDIGFGTKQFGDGRDRELLKNHFKNRVIVTPRQSHSTSIIEYTSGMDINPDHCDGVITCEKNVVLTVITADCLPIVYYDANVGIMGISHQGWKGTLHRMPVQMINRMIAAGSSIKNIRCVFGPAINDCCYEIYGERLKQFQNEFQSDSIFRKEKAKYFLNLYKANYQTLRESGVLASHIQYFPFCTSCDSKRFYSYHRDKKIIGEMISFVLI